MYLISYNQIIDFAKQNIKNINTLIYKNYVPISSIIIGFVLLPITIKGIIYGIGFRITGIITGSFASWFMSLYGGTIAPGSLISILQSVGAAGFSKFGLLMTGITGYITSNSIINFIKNRFIK